MTTYETTRLMACGLSAIALLGCGSDDRRRGTGIDASTSSDAGSDAGEGADAGGVACLDPPEPSPVGGACRCQGDCASGLLCDPEPSIGWPGGICTALCGATAECGTDGTCVTMDGASSGVCQSSCGDHGECRAGWRCFYGSCNPHCTEDVQCESGHCDPYVDLCSDGSPRSGGGVMEPCIRGDECKSGVCLDATGGHCMYLCAVSDGDCPDGSICLGGVDSSEPALGVCTLSCTTTTDCPSGLECLAGGPGGARVCWIAAS